MKYWFVHFEVVHEGLPEPSNGFLIMPSKKPYFSVSEAVRLVGDEPARWFDLEPSAFPKGVIITFFKEVSKRAYDDYQEWVKRMKALPAP